MVPCATSSTDPLAPVREGTRLRVGLFIFIINDLRATPAQRCLGQSGPRVTSLALCRQVFTDHRAKSHLWSILVSDSNAGRFLEE